MSPCITRCIGKLRRVSRVLRMQGYRVLEANSGHEALEVAERHDRPVDLLLSGMDGIELSRSIRAQRPATKVVFMSGSGTLKEFDGAPFLSKPFAIPELLRTVKDILLRDGSQTHNNSAPLLAEAAV